MDGEIKINKRRKKETFECQPGLLSEYKPEERGAAALHVHLFNTWLRAWSALTDPNQGTLTLSAHSHHIPINLTGTCKCASVPQTQTWCLLWQFISFQKINLQLLHLSNAHWQHCRLLHVFLPHTSSAHLSEGLSLDLFKFLQRDKFVYGCVKQRHDSCLVALILYLCKEMDDFWTGQEWQRVEFFLLFMKRIVWDKDEP